MATSLVLELQELAQSNSTPLPELLRRAKVVTVKLGLKDLALWIDHELEGYPESAGLPAYRRVPTSLMARNPLRGLIPVEWQRSDWVSEHFSHGEMRHPIAQLLVWAEHKSGMLEAEPSADELRVLNKISPQFARMPAVRIIPASTIAAIPDAVRSRILNWALELESRGILGEGLTFSTAEQERAITSSITLNLGPVVTGQNAQVASSLFGSAVAATGSQIGAVASGSHAAARGQVHQAQLNDLAEIRKLVDVLVSNLEGVPEAQRGDILEHGADLKEEVSKDEPRKSRLKATLAAIGVGLPAVITWAPKAVEAYEKIKHFLQG